MKKIIGIIRNILIGILGAIFFSFAIAMSLLLLNYNNYGVPQFDNTSLILIKRDIASEKYKKGDLVIIEGKDIRDIKVGDEIFVYQVTDRKVVNIDLGVVGDVDLETKEVSFENGATYSIQYVIGQATKVYNKIGTYLAIILSKWGFLFIILVPCFLIFIYELYALIIEIKYGKEDDEIASAPSVTG
ncbi:MAG: hypothetical protein ACOXZS_02255 [Bacilli bacterium]|jgi:hypothetical protein